MLTVNYNINNLLQRANSEIFVVIEIYIDPDTYSYYRICSGAKQYLGYPNLVHSISPVSYSLDIEQFSSKNSGMMVQIIDEGVTYGTHRHWSSQNTKKFYGKEISMYLGINCPDFFLTYDNLVPIWSGYIEEIIPGNNKFEIKCSSKTITRRMNESNYYLSIANKHPRSLILNVLPFEISLNLSQRDIFKPWAEWNDRHFVVRNSNGTLAPGYSGIDQLNNLCKIMRSWLVKSETGSYLLMTYDSSDSVLDTWYDSDIDDVKYETIYRNLINHNTLKYSAIDVNASSAYDTEDFEYIDSDSDSQDLYGEFGLTYPSYSQQDAECNDKMGILDANISSATTAITVTYTKTSPAAQTYNNGMCWTANADNDTLIKPGASWASFDYTTHYVTVHLDDGTTTYDVYLLSNPATQTQFMEAWYDRILYYVGDEQFIMVHKRSADYGVYVAPGMTYYRLWLTTNASSSIVDLSAWQNIYDANSNVYLRFPDNGEIVKVTATPTFTAKNVGSVLHEDAVARNQYVEFTIGYTIARGQLGTSAAAHSEYDPVEDITMIMRLSDYYINRFADGCPIVTLRTNLSKIAIQIGDFVSLELLDIHWTYHSGATSYEVNGITGADIANHKWQVIQKSVDLFSSKPSIKWKLAYVG